MKFRSDIYHVQGRRIGVQSASVRSVSVRSASVGSASVREASHETANALAIVTATFLFFLGVFVLASTVRGDDTSTLSTSGDSRVGTGDHPSIQVGESLTFGIRWGIIPAGTATMSITEQKDVSGHPCYHIVSTAVSNPVFDKIYTVRDQFESFMDTGDLKSWAFKKHLREGKFRRDQVVRKDHDNAKAYYHDGKVVDLTPGAYDVLSAFYFVRTMPLKEGDVYELDSHTDRKNYPIKVKVHRREKVTVPAGTFDCVVVEPMLQSGDFFKNEGSLHIWLTDDDRRMPVQMKSKIPVGSIAVELESFERPLDNGSGSVEMEVARGGQGDRGRAAAN